MNRGEKSDIRRLVDLDTKPPGIHIHKHVCLGFIVPALFPHTSMGPSQDPAIVPPEDLGRKRQ